MAPDDRETYTILYTGPTAEYYQRLSAISAAPEVLDVDADKIVAVKHALLTDWLALKPSRSELDTMALKILRLLLRVHKEAQFCHRDVHVRNIVLTEAAAPLLIDPALGADKATELCYDLHGPGPSGVAIPAAHVRQGKDGIWWGSQERHDSLESAFGRWQELR